MTEGTFADEDAARVGRAVADTFADVLAQRLRALVVHGGAITGYVAGFSDFDFVVFAHGKLTLDDDFTIEERLRDIDRGPFTYLQVSRVVNVDDSAERMSGLIGGGYVVVRGALPPGWSLHTAEVLRERGQEVIESIPGVVARLAPDWAVAGAPERRRIIRYLATDLKPALRATLVALGEPVFEVWRAPYPELARRLAAHDAALGARVATLIAQLPPAADREAHVAREMFALLDAIYAANGRVASAPTSNV